jgi:hypothetical protein
MDLGLTGKNSIVTGGSKGIRREIFPATLEDTAMLTLNG